MNESFNQQQKLLRVELEAALGYKTEAEQQLEQSEQNYQHLSAKYAEAVEQNVSLEKKNQELLESISTTLGQQQQLSFDNVSFDIQQSRIKNVLETC